MKKFLGIFSFSLLLGALLGLSSAPVVGALVAALTGFLGVVVGLRSNLKIEKIVNPNVDFAGLGIFGVATLAGVFLGLFVRTEAPWGKSAQELKVEWIAAGIEASEANRLVVFQKTGLIPAGWGEPNNQAQADITQPVLFSSDEVSDKLNPANYKNVTDISTAWSMEGEPWRTYQSRIETRIADENKKIAYDVIWKIISDH